MYVGVDRQTDRNRARGAETEVDEEGLGKTVLFLPTYIVQIYYPHNVFFVNQAEIVLYIL